MPRLTPLSLKALPDDMSAMMKGAEKAMGFLPNDGLTMARSPGLFKAMVQMVDALYSAGTVAPELKRLIGNVTSAAAGCQYCEAHTAHGAYKLGVSQEKLDAVWTFETSPLFSERERAALCVAFVAGQSPSTVTDEQFEALHSHFSEDEIVEIVGVIALFGFLNRWNATLATEIESSPLAFAHQAPR